MSDFKPTTAQKRAVTSVDRSVCVRAGAGTGKTSVLVGRYMELLRRRRASVHEIAALTYTEKAAKVMKDRIRRACFDAGRRARGTEAVAWWRRQRIDLESASISTIHAFCSRLLSEHPVEAGVDPQFTVLDRVEQGVLLEKCIDDVVKRALEDEDDGTLRLCRSFTVPGVRRMLTQMFARRDDASEAAAPIVSKTDDEIVAAWQGRLKEAQSAHLAAVLTQLAAKGVLKSLEDAVCIDATDGFASRRAEVLRVLTELAKGGDDERRSALACELRRAVYNLRGGSAAKWSGDDLRTVKDAFRAIRDMLDAVPGGSFDRTASGQDKAAIAFTRVLIRSYDAVAAAYRDEKTAGGTLDFDDLLLKARELLERSGEVRRRVQRKIRYLLVDELQDSALIERDVILLIVRDEGALTRRGERRIVAGKLFVVGDDKQSIYRFRGAEVSVFREFAEMIGAADVVDLDVSFRTVPSGVAFANDFFGRLLGREPRAASYESRYFDLHPSRKEDCAFLEVLVPEPDAQENAGDARAREARMIAARILEMVNARERLVYDRGGGRFRPVTFGDVAVLFRAMTQTAIYEHAFREASLPYYIVRGGGFYRMQEVLDMLVALKALERVRDDVALVGVLRSPLFGISDETLFFMWAVGSVREGLDRAEDVPDLTDDQRRGLIDAREILRGLRAVKNRVPISRLLEAILAETGYDAVLLAQFMGRQKLANVEKLIDLARTFEAKGLFTLDDFIRYIEKFVDDAERESERAAEEESGNVVRIMSVHQAKGMEFPVVFVADMSHQTRGPSQKLALDRDLGMTVDAEAPDATSDGEHPILYDLIRREDRRRDDAENLRTLYVALTRAQDHLVMSGWLRRGKVPGNSWLRLLSDHYGLVDDAGTVAAELVYGEARHSAPVHTGVAEVAAAEGRERHHAAWKVVRRLKRLAERMDAAANAPAFDRAASVQPLPLDLRCKRRFVPSEFTEYGYCPHRYRLSNIEGVLPANMNARARTGGVGGAELGTMVHRVLAAWDLETASLDAEIAHAGAGMALTQPMAVTRLMAEAGRITRAAHAAGVFAEIAASSERHSEYPLAARVGDFVIDGIIDSLHRLADGTFEIVDYKTDRVDAAGVPECAAHYELQLAAYAVALSRSGRDVSRVSLIFLRAGRRHAWRCDATQLAAWERKLASMVADIRHGRFDVQRDGPCRCGLGWVCERAAGDVDDLDLV